MKKSMLSTAIVTAMGVATGLAAMTTSPTASAAAVTGFTIKDVGSNTMGSGGYSSTLDGVSGAFTFSSAYLNAKTYPSANTFTGDVASGTIFGEGAANSTGSFTTGFLFTSSPFVPFTYGSGLVADEGAGDGALTVTSLDFGGNYGVNFLLAPDGNFPLEILWSKANGNVGEWDVAMRWGHHITTAEDATGNFTNFEAQWVLEGCMTTNAGGKCATSAVPIPAAAWLFGSGLVGLAGVARRRKTKA